MSTVTFMNRNSLGEDGDEMTRSQLDKEKFPFWFSMAKEMIKEVNNFFQIF